MAYEYKVNLDEGGYVEFNFSPGSNFSYGVGDTITITGRIKSSYMAIKSVEISFQKFFRDDNGNYYGGSFSSYINKSISKGTLSSFTISHTITQANIIKLASPRWSNRVESFPLYISIYDKPDGPNGDWTKYDITNYVESCSITFIRQRKNPTVLCSLSDRYIVRSGDVTALEYFENYIQNYSLPTIEAHFETDPDDIKLTAIHHLIIKDDEENIIFDMSENTEAGATLINFDIPVISNPGIYYYTWTVTDSAGNSGKDSNTFTVLSYFPPAITTFLLERYKYVIGEGNVIADDGEKLLTTFEGSVAPVRGTNSDNMNAWTLSFSYKDIDRDIDGFQSIISGINGRNIEYNSDATAFTNTISAGSTFNFIVTLSDMLNSVKASYVVLKAGGYLNVEKTGVSVGMRSTSTASNKKFEVASDYESHFYGGIAGISNYPPIDSNTNTSEEELTGGHWVDGKPLYRKIYHITSVDSNNTINIDISDLNYDFIKWEDYINITYSSDVAQQWINTYYWSGNNDRARIYIYDTQLRFRLGTDLHLSTQGAWIILEYTKTTDTSIYEDS